MTSILQKLAIRKYNNKHCFLCGKRAKRLTKEHVIPKWAQKRFNLADRTISLLNGTLVPYRHLTVPCCTQCNQLLGKLELKVRNAVAQGFAAVRDLERNELYLWLSKIFFDLLYRELSLRVQQADPASPTIMTPEMLAELRMHNLFMQGVRERHSFVDFHPASIFVFETQIPVIPERQWDFMDNLPTQFIAVRMGEAGIVAVLQDGGANQQLEPHLSDFKSIALHPIQFREVAAKVAYKAMLFNRTPKYLSWETPSGVQTTQLPLQGFSNKPVFDPWDQAAYAQILGLFTGYPPDQLNPEPDKVWTSIKTPEGQPNFLPVE